MNSGALQVACGNPSFLDTAGGVYVRPDFSAEGIGYQLEDGDDLIDEVGEAEDDRATVGIDDEEYTGPAGMDLSTRYLESGEEDYAALELPPAEIYLNSLLDTDIDVVLPYNPRARMDVAGSPFYEVSYYKGLGAEEIAEPGPDSEPEEPIFSAKPTSVEDDLDEDPDLNLEARLGMRN